MSEAAQILVRTGADLKTFREEIQPGGRPVALENLLSDWPAVRAAPLQELQVLIEGHLPGVPLGVAAAGSGS